MTMLGDGGEDSGLVSGGAHLVVFCFQVDDEDAREMVVPWWRFGERLTFLFFSGFCFAGPIAPLIQHPWRWSGGGVVQDKVPTTREDGTVTAWAEVTVAGVLGFWYIMIEGVYLSAAFIKVPQGGWVPLVLSFFFMAVMYVWHYGTCRKYSYDLHNKVSLKWLLGLGPSLGIVRVPGIGLIYTELATGIPAIFSHFVTNLPAFHRVLVFVCVKSVPVPYVSPEERFLIGRVCPRPYRMYRCIVRYGYKDIQRDDGDFENHLIQSIAEFIQMEAVEPQFSSSEASSLDGRMAVISSRNLEYTSSLIVSEQEDVGVDISIPSSRSVTLRSLQSVYDDESPQVRRRRVRFQLPENPGMNPDVKEELLDLIQAKDAGVAYIMGHSYVKARKSSSFLKKLVIDIGYSFLRKNCRGPAVALNIPHISLIEVGMIYYV